MAEDRTGVVARLDALEAAHKTATPGPWWVDGTLGPVMGAAILPPYGTSEVPVVAVDAGVVREADAAAIVAEHNSYGDLLAAVRGMLALADAADEKARQSVPAAGAERLIAEGVHTVKVADLRSTVAAALGEA